MRAVTPSGGTIELGTLQTGPVIGITDYSRRATDDFGVTTIVERGFARTLSVRLAVPIDAVDQLQRDLAALRAQSVAWIADDDIESLQVEGFFKDFSIDVAMPPLSYCSLSIEGLTEDAVGSATAPHGVAPDGQASTLQLLEPINVTSANLTTSSVAETDHAEWSAGTTYALGARVIRAASHRIYESLVAGNIGNNPITAADKWLDTGPTNRWAMFDQAVGTVTSAAGSIAVTIAIGSVDAVALLDVVAATVRVRAQGYDRTLAVSGGTVSFLDLDGASGPVIVTITGPGTVSAGTLLAGDLIDLGVTEASPTAGITDFSRKTIDDFGAVTIVQRAWVKRMTAAALIRTDAIDAVVSAVAAVRARPCLWIGQAAMDTLTIYGFFKDFSIEAGETLSKLSLSIEGLSTAARVTPLSVDWENVTDNGGTRPDDNATQGAPAGTTVAGRSAEDVVLGIDGSDIRQAILAADAEVARLRVRALNYPGPAGESHYTLVVREQTARAEANDVFAETFNLLGAVDTDRTAFVLDLDTVKVGASESFAQRLDLITATFGDNEASISQINEVLVGPGGGVARALFLLDVDGRVTGQVSTNDGTVGTLSFLTDAFSLIDPDTGDAYFYADADGKVIMENVEVDTIKARAITGTGFNLGALGAAGFYFRDSDVTASFSGWTDIATVTVTPAFGKPLLIHGSTFARSPDSGSTPGNIRLVRIAAGVTTIISGGDSAASRLRVEADGETVAMACVDGSVQGQATTYSFQMKRASPGERILCAHRFMSVVEQAHVDVQTFDIAAATGEGPAAGATGGGGVGVYDPNQMLADPRDP